MLKGFIKTGLCAAFLAQTACAASAINASAGPNIAHNTAASTAEKTADENAVNIGNMVASSADPRVSEAGMEILRQGGSAADAAMAMMLALSVVEPQSSGIGGGGFLLYQNSENGQISSINGRETAPAAANSNRFLDADGKALSFYRAVPGGKSVGVPGNMRLMEMTHQKWGKLPWATLFAPAIKLAEDGFEVNATLNSRLLAVERFWVDFPETQKIYYVDGKPAPVGSIIKNPEMAATLRLMAKEGADSFYQGSIASSIVDKVQNAPVNPADMTMSDLANYKAKEQDAICSQYRVYVICGMGPPSSGASTVLQILGSIERFDMGKLGKDNPQSWHIIHEAMRLAYADREKYLADPAMVDVPIKGLLDKQYLAERSAMIDPEKSRADYPAGTPKGAPPRTAAISSEVAGTTHFVAVDKNGNVASMTSTIEGIFGSQMTASGFFLNNELTDFTFAPEKEGAPVANRVEAGKQPLSSMSPTIVFDKNGKAILALGSAGGKRIIMHVTKSLIGVLDFGLPLQEAIALPNIYWSGDVVQVEEDTFLSAMADELAAFGKAVQASDLGSKVNGAEWTDKGWTGAADPRSEGTAIISDEKGNIIAVTGQEADTPPPPSVY
ncbi:gamma-glutamyltransferase [Sphingorhabdus lutea]|uniref:Glutathione hydrolase proenzyme n=1 Tax=Sphingorhabdus lutea TaxID=1913578 RepID=A0A1L3JDK0_9SPHN|nr:gamma-glutamyltransferase [Sphingorhabdus lutea]APG63202.1 gamma-glutamyltransferase [Sphingorhabdus lutea]